MPRLDAPETLALGADVGLADAEQLREVLVGEAVALGLDEHVIGQEPALMHQYLLLLLHQLAHLVDEIPLDAGALEDLLVGRPLAQSLVHQKMPLA